MMTLKELLKNNFGMDLPISGGTGNSIDNPIIIHKKGINDYVGTEHVILRCLGVGRNVEWKMIGQRLLSYNDRRIDQIKIETKQETANEIITQVENYYFDITECFGQSNQPDSTFDERDTFEKIKSRIVELEAINEFNKQCIYLLKKGKLFKDFQLTMDFINVILKDKSIGLFDDMMKYKKKPIMEVLSQIGEELNQD